MGSTHTHTIRCREAEGSNGRQQCEWLYVVCEGGLPLFDVRYTHSNGSNIKKKNRNLQEINDFSNKTTTTKKSYQQFPNLVCAVCAVLGRLHFHCLADCVWLLHCISESSCCLCVTLEGKRGKHDETLCHCNCHKLLLVIKANSGGKKIGTWKKKLRTVRTETAVQYLFPEQIFVCL